MSVRDNILKKLTAALNPLFLEITDDSHRHKGHMGHNPDGESHFSVTVVSDAFEGLSRVARQRRVYGVLAEEMKERVHALSLKALTPAEYKNP